MAEDAMKPSGTFSLLPGDNDSAYILLREVIRCGNECPNRREFLGKIAQLLLEYSGCDAVFIKLQLYNKYFCCEAVKHRRYPFELELTSYIEDIFKHVDSDHDEFLDMEGLCRIVLDPSLSYSGESITGKGGFFTKGECGLYPLEVCTGSKTETRIFRSGGGYKSYAVLPLVGSKEKIGVLVFRSQDADFFSAATIIQYEPIVESIGYALLDRNRQTSLKERIKELACLNSIASIIEDPGKPLSDILQEIVNLLPSAWMYPDIAVARIVVNGDCYTSGSFPRNTARQYADIILEKDAPRGFVEIAYKEEMPERYEGPFLKEERNLINTIARQIALIIQRKNAEEEQHRLMIQLQHADRLATVGQLAAGVAHELNEPLAAILGYAQLVLEDHGISGQSSKDIEKIIKSSLYARDIVKKLLLFSRQMKPSLDRADINKVIREAMFLLESRCQKENVTLEYDLQEDISLLDADAGQLQQVVINLVVNAIQAMPGGGKLTIKTKNGDKSVILTVSDTGKGITDEEKRQMFIPFFTTKDVDKGTGLGLSVVHGIIMAHKGDIAVTSAPGKGTRFIITLPVLNTNTGDNHDAAERIQRA